MKKNYIIPVGVIGITTIIIFTTLIFNNKVFSANKIGADRPPVHASDLIKALNKTYTDVSTAVLPSVVSIGVKVEKKSASDIPQHQNFPDFFKFFGEPQDFGPMEGSGSGVIISEDGYIVTNRHVIDEANDIKVITFDKKEYKAKLIGSDPNTDLAVVKIEETNLPFVHFANPDDIKVGGIVFAVGNPLGLNSTVTSGIISYIGRGGLDLPKRSSYSVENYIQTDAAINPGNSGGGLFDIEGSLVGINTAIASQTGSYIGYGFAIPVDLVKSTVIDLIENGKVSRGYLGVQIKSLNKDLAKSLGLDKVDGVLVNDIVKDSPAEKAGVEIGDIILDLDGKVVKTSNELQAKIAEKKPGNSVSLTIWRDGNKITKSVKLAERPGSSTGTQSTDEVSSNESESNDNIKSYNFDLLGFTVDNPPQEVKESYNIDGGAYITKVNRGSIAYDRGLFAQGVIIKADKKKIKSVGDLKKIINSKKPGETVLLQVKYKDNNNLVAMEIPTKK